MKPTGCIVFFAVFLCMSAARAMIVYDGDSSDNTYNTSAPGNGAPWDYVAEVTNSDVSTDASAVYLGNDFLITANHVNLGSSILLDGTSYSIDNTYTPVQLGSADLKLFKITGTTGLPALPLIGALDVDLDQSDTMIGWGVGKGSVITSGSDIGWNWGDDSTRAQRWGTNVTLSSYATDSNSVLYLQTAFNTSLGDNVYSASLGDSGSALFEEFSGTWKLAGVYVGVDTANASYYADSPNNPSGMDYSYAVAIKPYASEIETDIPEPGSVMMIGTGGAALAFYARARRRQAARYIRPRFL